MDVNEELNSFLEKLHALFDGLEDLVYVADPDTYEILFANDKFAEIFGGNVLGKKCYEVIHGFKSPCVFCTNKHIFGENIGKIHIREYQCREKGRTYKCIDKAISWPGKKHVKFEIAVDITEHKQMEKALMESERQHRVFVETAPDVIYRISADGKLISLNPAFEKITGWKREEWIGKPFTDIIHPEDVAKAFESFQKTLKGKPEPVELRVRSKSSGYLVGEFVSVPMVEDGKIVGELGIARDITERKKYEEELQRINATLHALIQAIPDIVYFKDAERRNLIVNSAFEKFLGLKRAEIVGKRDEELLPWDLAVQCRKSDEEVLRKGVAFRAEEQFSDEKFGRRFFETIKVPIFDRHGRVAGLIGVSRDVTERKIIEEKLGEREELFRSIVENSHDGIAIIDENCKITYANDELAVILGYPKEEIIGQELGKFLAKESKTLFTDRKLRRQAEQRKEEKVFSKYELKVVRKTGEERDVEVKAKTIRDAQAGMRTIIQVLDITGRKQLEEERNLFEKRLTELNEYAQKLNKAKSLKEIYKLTLDAMEKTLGFEYASIFMIEEKFLRMVAYRGCSKVSSLKLSLDKDKGITVKAAKTGKPVIVPDVRTQKAYVEGGKGALSELAVPMKAGRKVIGVLNVESRKLAVFSEEDRKLLEILASHAAVAIKNLERREKLAALNACGRKLNRAKSVEDVCEYALKAVQKILGFKYVAILLVEEKKLQLAACLGFKRAPKLNLPLNGEKGVTVKAAREGRTVFVPDVRKEKAYVEVGIGGVISELAVPIKIGRRVLGVLNVESRSPSAFDEEDKRLLEILASHVGIAISNIRRRESLALLSKKLEYLVKSATKIMQTKNIRERLKQIAETIHKFGWKKVTISLRDENLELKDIVASGFTQEEFRILTTQKIPASVWKELLSPEFERFKIDEFYYLSRDDKRVPSKVFSEYFIAYYTRSILYAPIRTLDGKIVAILTISNPEDPRKPAKETLMPVKLFLYHAAKTIELIQLMESLEKARKELQLYADHLEQMVEERTRALKEVQEKLLRSQRLAVIGELAGMVGHDLRNPLTSIAGATYYIKKRLNQTMDGKIAEMIELIEKNIEYSNKIINDLLDYSREVKLDITETTPEELVKEALASVEIPNNILVVNLTGKKPKMKADFEKMKRTFVNLVRNAVEAMPKGGTLTIKSREINGKVEFTLSDTGIGMTEEIVKKLWTPLFTTKAKGMGFGLSICKRFVEAHGGTITVQSAPRKGTTFTVTLPTEPKIIEGGENVWLKAQESSLLTTTKT